MKCPYCEYENGWSQDKDKTVDGEDGMFFILSNNVVATRPVDDYMRENETEQVYFCPKCGKCFIET